MCVWSVCVCGPALLPRAAHRPLQPTGEEGMCPACMHVCVRMWTGLAPLMPARRQGLQACNLQLRPENAQNTEPTGPRTQNRGNHWRSCPLEVGL